MNPQNTKILLASIILVSALVEGAGADTVNLVGTATDFTGTATDTLTLLYDGTKWFELCRSVN